MDKNELKDRLETIYTMVCIAIMTKEKYIEILNNKENFAAIYPGVEFENPKINFSIEENSNLLETTKTEITNEHNHDLFKAWQIAFGIAGMTAILESYLKYIAEHLFSKKCNTMGLLYKFQKITNLDFKDYQNYSEINRYYQVRHIIFHNLGIVDEKFNKNIYPEKMQEKAYMFYPSDLKKYLSLIINLADYIDKKINKNNRNIEATSQ